MDAPPALAVFAHFALAIAQSSEKPWLSKINPETYSAANKRIGGGCTNRDIYHRCGLC